MTLKSKILRAGPMAVTSGLGTLFHINAANVSFLLRQLIVSNVSDTTAALFLWISLNDPAFTSPAIFSPEQISGGITIIQPAETINYKFDPGLKIARNEFLISGGFGGAMTATLCYEVVLTDLT